MINIKRDDDSSFLVYQNKRYIGLVVAKDLQGKILYTAIDRDGFCLGETYVYGQALNLVLTFPQGFKKYLQSNGDD